MISERLFHSRPCDYQVINENNNNRYETECDIANRLVDAGGSVYAVPEACARLAVAGFLNKDIACPLEQAARIIVETHQEVQNA